MKQGSCLSPAIFNVFMNVFILELKNLIVSAMLMECF